MDTDQTADDHEVLDGNMTAKGRSIGYDVPVADAAIVGDMAVHHQQIFIAHPGHHPAARCTRVQGDVFTNGIAISDNELARLSFIFEILRGGTDGGEGKYDIAFAYRGSSLNSDVRHDFAALADLDARPDHAIRPDLHVTAQLRTRIDDCGRMHPAHLFEFLTRDPLPWLIFQPARPISLPQWRSPASSKTIRGA